MMPEEKSKVRQAIDSLKSSAIVFLFGEKEESPSQVKFYTKDEIEELEGTKRDIQRYPK